MSKQNEAALAKAYALACTGLAATARDDGQLDLAAVHTLMGEIVRHIEDAMP